MLKKLADLSRLRQDLEKFSSTIESITQEKSKKRGLELLEKLKQQIRLIDEGHNPRNNGFIDPKRLRDNIIEVIKIKKELERMVKDSQVQ